MSSVVRVEEKYVDPTLNLALDTLQKDKQALIFCNTRRGAEAQAERTANKVKESSDELIALSEKILSVVQSPTRQCKRLASCIKKGIAFHHAGLHAKQRELIETSFRENVIRIITSTPTLAMGVDLPAYRSIVRDLKRYTKGTSWGMSDIPVLEWEQCAGRAGRPGMEDKGEAICIAKTESEKEYLTKKYLYGDPEEIYSKLAVEPVLRTYVLSLISSGYVHNTDSLYKFFDGTFYAWQYENTDKLHNILDKMVTMLQEWTFLEGTEFMTADDMTALKATKLGERVAQLYLDPYTAHHLLDALEKGEKRKLSLNEFPLLHLISTTLEIRPLVRVRQAELDDIDNILMEHEDALFVKSPSLYSHEYEEFLQTIKTARVLQEWVSETGEDIMYEKYNTTPGELHAKRSIADWLLYSLTELAKLRKWHGLIVKFERMRVRLAHGAKEELLPLLRLKNIGRIRARKLFRNGIKSIAAVKQADIGTLTRLLGNKIALNVKEQVGHSRKEEKTQLADYE